VRFGSSQHATSATTTSDLDPRSATSDISARKGSSNRARFGRETLTKEGGTLEAHRRDYSPDHRQDHRQEFYAGLKKPRGGTTRVYRACLREADRPRTRARIDRRPRLRLKRSASRAPSGITTAVTTTATPTASRTRRGMQRTRPPVPRPGSFPRSAHRISRARWAVEHQALVTTVHYRGAHGKAAAQSDFSCYRGSSARIGGGGGGRTGGGRSTLPRLAEEFLD
jgi:hypothetical protein